MTIEDNYKLVGKTKNIYSSCFQQHSCNYSLLMISEYLFIHEVIFYKIIPQKLDIAFSGLYLRHRKNNAKRDK